MKKRSLDLASSVTLVVTVVLFALALFEKGLTHDLLLEAGVFLVSLKLVLASRKSELESLEILKKMDEVLARLGRK